MRRFRDGISVRIVQAGARSWVWRVADDWGSAGGWVETRDEAWACALSALRGALKLRAMRAGS